MSALGETYGGSGPCHTFKLRDPVSGDVVKVYELRLIDDEVKGMLEKRIFERARDVLFGLRQGMTDEMYERRLNKLADDYMQGVFSPFTSKAGQDYLKSRQGALALLALVFQCPEAEAMSLGGNPKNQAEVESLIKIVLKESFRGVDMKRAEEEFKKKAEAGEAEDDSGNSGEAGTPAGMRV